MSVHHILTQAELKRQLLYNPETGLFTWLVSNSNRVKIGSIAGNINKDGRIEIGINKKVYKAHRIAWLYVHGYLPELGIDHINGNASDNRINNLRHVSQRCNMQNCKISSNNTSGFPGVCWHKQNNNWLAAIMINRKKCNLGSHPTALEAALARYTAEVCDPRWTCNYRSELVKAIKRAWPEFQVSDK